MSETTAVKIARLEERQVSQGETLKAILAEMQSATAGRKRIYEAMAETGTELRDVKTTVQSLDKRVGAIEPSVEDYKLKVMQVQIAGRIGRWAWAIGGFILATLAWVAGWWESILRALRQ